MLNQQNSKITVFPQKTLPIWSEENVVYLNNGVGYQWVQQIHIFIWSSSSGKEHKMLDHWFFRASHQGKWQNSFLFFFSFSSVLYGLSCLALHMKQKTNNKQKNQQLQGRSNHSQSFQETTTVSHQGSVAPTWSPSSLPLISLNTISTVIFENSESVQLLLCFKFSRDTHSKN